MTTLKAPFPYVGGKTRITDRVWFLLGDVRNYTEPFFGSGSMLLRRPHLITSSHVETVSDANHHLANVWRAIKNDPEQVAYHANFPINEVEMHVWHRYLQFSERAAKVKQLVEEGDPDVFDAEFAGRWIWGQCMWIGAGWCLPRGHRKDDNTQRTRSVLADNSGVHGSTKHQAPAGHGKGVQAKRPHIAGTRSGGERGVHGGRVQLGDAFSRGRGVHGNDHAMTDTERLQHITSWMIALMDRLRPVRVCCGNWTRLCDSNTVTTRIGTTGVYLDPPYKLKKQDGTKSRSAGLYHGDEDPEGIRQLHEEISDWCIRWGNNPKMRIVLSGLEGEHDELLEHGWQVEGWETNGGYGNRAEGGSKNRDTERLWISPHCERDVTLFD